MSWKEIAKEVAKKPERRLQKKNQKTYLAKKDKKTNPRRQQK